MGSNRNMKKSKVRNVAFKKARLEKWGQTRHDLEQHWASQPRLTLGVGGVRVATAQCEESRSGLFQNVLKQEEAIRHNDESHQKMEQQEDGAGAQTGMVQQKNLGHQGTPQKSIEGFGDNCKFCKAMKYDPCRCEVL